MKGFLLTVKITTTALIRLGFDSNAFRVLRFSVEELDDDCLLMLNKWSANYHLKLQQKLTIVETQ